MPKVTRLKGGPVVATARAGGGCNPDDGNGANDAHAPWASKQGVDHDGSSSRPRRGVDHAEAGDGGGGKRQRGGGDNREAADDADAAARAADEELAAYMAQLLKEGRAMGDLSFGELYGRSKNAAQQAVHDAYLADTKELVEWALAHGIVLNPDSLIWRLINKNDDMFTMDNSNSHIYVKVEEDGSIKVGVAGHGGTRVWYYIKKAGEKGLPDPELISSIDVDNIPAPLQRELVRRVLDIAAKYMCPEFPADLRKAFAYDMQGLALGTQVFFRSIVKSVDECSVIGGGKAVWGFMRRAIIHMLEDGLQVLLLERGYPINDEHSLHESVDSAVLSHYVYRDHKIRKNVRKCVAAILSKKKERKRASEESVDAKGVFSWEPEDHPSKPENFQEATPLLADLVFRKKWFDPLGKLRARNPDDHEDCHDPSQFTRSERGVGYEKTIDEFGDVERYGGGRGVDECKAVWEHTESGSVVEYLCEERTTLLGHEPGSGWYVAWEATGITVLVLDWDEDDLLRVIVVFIPWCKMIWVKGRDKVSWKQLMQHMAATESAHWAYYFFDLLQETNSTLVPDDSLDRLTKNDIYFNWCIGYLHQSKFTKVPLRTANLTFKQLMTGSELNVYTPPCTNMLRINDLDLVGTCPRQLLARLLKKLDELEDGDDLPESVRRDNKFVRYVISKASDNCATPDQIAQCMFDCLEDNRHEHDVGPLASSRHGIIMRKTNVFPTSLLRRFDAIYQSTRQNRGNRAVIRNIALPDAIEDVNEMLTWIVNNSEPGAPVKFFVQGDGAAKKGSPTCGKYGGMEGMPFVLPEDGTIIPPERPGGDSVVFRRANFLPGISFGGVRTRCRGTHGAGNTKRKRAVKFLDHKVDFNRDIFRFSDKGVTYMNEFRVAQVWFVPK